MRAPLIVICGPMFAGKTTELQRRIALAQAAGERVLVSTETGEYLRRAD